MIPIFFKVRHRRMFILKHATSLSQYMKKRDINVVFFKANKHVSVHIINIFVSGLTVGGMTLSDRCTHESEFIQF